MKTLILSLLTVLTFSNYSNAQQMLKGAKIELEQTTIDFGTIVQDSEPKRELIVTNTGSEPLVISRCKGSCGCTTPVCSSEPILPGASRKIVVRYDTHRIGPINRTVTITSNAVNNPSVTVQVLGKVTELNKTPYAREQTAPMKNNQ